jgi:alpha-aminoadipate carrier protein LysW
MVRILISTILRRENRVTCPNCDAVIDVDEEELDEGETLSCDECGATLTVSSLNPLELEVASDEDDEDEDEEDFDFDEDEDEEQEEEDEEL